jgi:tRNA U55 pseudouridine synthase TruB
LIRTSYGPFNLKDAVTLEQLEIGIADGSWSAFLQPMDAVLSPWEKILLSEDQVEMVRCGVGLPLETVAGALRLRAYDKTGMFLALLKLDPESRSWRPQKVFHPAVTVPEKRPIP